MRRVQRDQREPTLLDPLDYFFSGLGRDFRVPHVAPPDEDLRPVEQRRIETLRCLVESGGAYKKPLLLERVGNRLAQESFAVGLLLFRLPFIPDEHPHRVCFFGTLAGSHLCNSGKHKK